MKDRTLSRRAVMLGTAALPVVQSVTAQARPRPVVISSANRNNGGVNCCAKAMEIIKSGGDTLDAAIAGVNIVEARSARQHRGLWRAAQRRRRGRAGFQLRARSHAAHGIGGGAARHQDSVQSGQTGDGADRPHDAGRGGRLAVRQGHGLQRGRPAHRRIAHRLAGVETVAARSPGPYQLGTGGGRPGRRRAGNRLRGEVLKVLREMFPHVDESVLEQAWDYAIHPPHGTINCIALNDKGEMSAVTTTSGLAWKIPGRLGDSPIIGGGLWLDNDVGGAGSTGRGEENLRVCGAGTDRREHAARHEARMPRWMPSSAWRATSTAIESAWSRRSELLRAS